MGIWSTYFRKRCFHLKEPRGQELASSVMGSLAACQPVPVPGPECSLLPTVEKRGHSLTISFLTSGHEGELFLAHLHSPCSLSLPDHFPPSLCYFIALSSFLSGVCISDKPPHAPGPSKGL